MTPLSTDPAAPPPPPGTESITTDDVQAYLQEDVDEDSADLAIRVAWGWLAGATNLNVFPGSANAPAAALWSWWLELAALAYDNPTSQATRTIGGEVSGWVISRRAEILASAAASYPRAGGGPRGTFPAPAAWPTL